MLYTPHFLTGAAIAKLIPDPIIFFPLGIISHVLLDLTPHNDLSVEPGVTIKDLLSLPPKRKLIVFGVVIGDFFVMCAVMIWIWMNLNDWRLIAGGLAGIIPDATEHVLLLFGKKLPGWFNNLQWRVSARYGFISYPIVSFISFYILYR